MESTVEMGVPGNGDGPGEYTVDEMAAAVGVSVRTVRFYAGKKLLPAPRLRGRTGVYGPAHVARLALIRDLQEAGYTLAAIEQFLAALPEDADADSVAMYGTLLTPWIPSETEVLTSEQLAERIGRTIDDEVLALLEEANVVVRRDDGTFEATSNQLDYGARLVNLGAPFNALSAANRIIQRHASEMAGELQHEFRSVIKPRYDDTSAEDRAQLRALVAAMRPLTIERIVTSFQEALDREVQGRRRER